MVHVSSMRARLLLAVVVLLSCVGCDQATKRIATQTLRDAPPRSYLANTLRLEYVRNPGGFLSVGNRLSQHLRFWLFTVANAAILFAVACFLAARWNRSLAVFVSALYVLAGGIGNLIDRVLQNGLVTDFINIGIGPLRTGIFNIADMALLFGGLAWVFLYRRDSAAEDQHASGAESPSP